MIISSEKIKKSVKYDFYVQKCRKPTAKSEIELKAWRNRKELPMLNFDNLRSWSGTENNLLMFDKNC
jgi:hypothetical protein